jgi:hypothetical protein
LKWYFDDEYRDHYPPTLTAEQNGTTVSVNWDIVSWATGGYTVYHGTTSNINESEFYRDFEANNSGFAMPADAFPAGPNFFWINAHDDNVRSSCSKYAYVYVSGGY